MNVMPSLWPGVVRSYDPARRTCRVSIDGITDGAQVLPEAVFNNPLGDSAATTEIRILPGDLVWLMFESGDPRFPIIMGYRTPRAGNPKDWRRWQHKNIQLIAEDTFLITVGATQITVTSGLVHIAGADTVMEENLTVMKNVTVGQNVVATQNITAGGQVADQGGAKTMSGMRTTFNGHTHIDGDGENTGTPLTPM